MQRIIGRLAAAALAIAIAGAAVAQEHRVVIELYTSQGCSSCPPADELFRTLAEREDVLPLALHVDYWDYIGWKDTFGSPAHTARQRAYAHAAGSKSIYTPQMVVGGREHLAGTQAMELGELIEEHSRERPRAALWVARDGGRLDIRAEPRGRIERIVVVQLVRYQPKAVVEISRGENAGRTLDYTNVVTEWREIGRWDGAGVLALSAEAAGPQPAAVILQEQGPGAILAAAVAR